MKLNRTKTIAMVATVAGALVVTSAGVAAARSGDAPLANVERTGFAMHEGRGPHGPAVMNGAATGSAIADYLGLTTAELQAERETGKSLADIAAERGRSVDGLVEVMLDQIAANLAANTHLTEEQRADRLAVLEDRVTAMVTIGHEPQQDQLHSMDRLHTTDRLRDPDRLQLHDETGMAPRPGRAS